MPKVVTQAEFIRRVKEVHGSKYNYSKAVFTGYRNKVKIVCPVHGIFEQTPTSHIYGKSGCPKCWATLNASGQLPQKYSVNDAFFDTIGEFQAWVLGFLYADGSVSKNKLSVSQSKDSGAKLLEKVREIVKYTGPIYHRKTKWADSHTLSITSHKIVRKLSEFGLLENKTYNCNFPTCIDDKTFYPFLRGYIDGDGCVGIYDSGTTDYLYLSWVGTKAFCDGCLKHLPFDVCVYLLNTSNNLQEIVIRGEKAVNIGYKIWENESLPSYYKEPIWRLFINNYNPLYLQYKDKKEKAKQLLKIMNPNRVAKELDLPFQTIYKWRKKWN